MSTPDTHTPTEADLETRPTVGDAAVLAVQSYAEIARGLAVLRDEVAVWTRGKMGRYGTEQINKSFALLSRSLQILDATLPIVMSPPSTLCEHIAGEIEEKFAHGDDDRLASEVAEFVRGYMAQEPVTESPA